jgi:4,5-dihydroxyphthalate decarboxylase
MSKLQLTMAISHYDHCVDIVSGRVPIEGIELSCMELPLHDIFQRTVGWADFDIAEMSTAKYVSMRSQGDDRLIALPVFLSRVARHSAIYVRRDKIKTAADFAGKRVGVPEWAQTAAVYGRGVMQHELGIDLAKIKWVQAGLGEAGRAEKVSLNLPNGLELTPVADRSLT